MAELLESMGAEQAEIIFQTERKVRFHIGKKTDKITLSPVSAATVRLE